MSFLDPLLLDSLTLPRELSSSLILYTASVGVIVAAAFCLPRTLLALLYIYILHPLDLLPATTGCHRIGLPPSPSSSLLHDEYDATKYSHGTRASSAAGSASWKIKSLWIYPIKSCAGVELSHSSVVATGLQHDRHFSFAHLRTAPSSLAPSDPSLSKPGPARWEFATQREYPLLANVRAEVWVPAGGAAFCPSAASSGVLRVVFPCRRRRGVAGLRDAVSGWLHGDAPGTAAFTLPYQPTAAQVARAGRLEPMKIWMDFPQALNVARMAAPMPLMEELRAYLGCRSAFTLFRSHELREVYRDAPRKEELGWQPVASFNDAYPINLLGLSSVRALEARQTEGAPRVSARRFRANVILEGTPPFEEEKWKYVALGGFEYYVAARCVRCKMPNVDPDTGLKHRAEPDRTIRATRLVDLGAPKGTGCLAMQLVPKLQLGDISVGDAVRVMAEGEHVYTPM